MREDPPVKEPSPSPDARDPSADDVAIENALMKKYYDEAGRSWWWRTPNGLLAGQSPRHVWSSRDDASPLTRDDVRRAADAAPLMGRAFEHGDS